MCVCVCVHTPHVGVHVCVPPCVFACLSLRACPCGSLVFLPAVVLSLQAAASPPLGPPPCSSCLATPRPDTAYAAAVTMETDMMSAQVHRGLWGCKVVASIMIRITTSTYPPCPEDPPHLFSTCPPINGFIWRPATPSCMVIGHPPCRPL